jgi:hypothetical protein
VAGIVEAMILLDLDPSVVKPGWTPLIITILLAAAVALLMISMRRHMRRVSVPYREELQHPAGGQSPSDGSGRDGDAGSAPATGSPGSPDDERHVIGRSG